MSTSLAKKLGLKAGMRVNILHAPKLYEEFFETWPEGIVVHELDDTSVDFIHIFATSHETLKAALKMAKPRLKKDGMLWISWPKKSASIPSDIGKFDVMKAGQSVGLVDVKVASIDADWSAHKFVYRLKDR